VLRKNEQCTPKCVTSACNALGSEEGESAEALYLGLIEEHVGGEVVHSAAAERAHCEICRTVGEEEKEGAGIWIGQL
jgi:hypothetical protein